MYILYKMENPPTPTPPPTPFSWTLDKTTYTNSIFAKKKMTEVCNTKRLYGFIKAEMGISYAGIDRYSFLPDRDELTQLQRYKELLNKKTGKFQVAFNLPKHKWGRIIPADYLSLSILHRPTRHSLCEGQYIDIDIENSCPNVINEICKTNQITDKKYLTAYANNPKELRAKIMEFHKVSKDIAKQLPIAILNGGSYKGWLKTNNIDGEPDMVEIKKLENEIKPVMDIIYSSNPHIIKDVLKQDANKWKTTEDKKRGVMGLFYQTVERHIQEIAIKYLLHKTEFKLEDIVPSQDGFMILPNLWYDEILTDLNAIIYKEIGLNITFKNKDFDEAIEIPEYGDEKTADEWEDALSAKMLSERFLSLYGERVVKYKSNLYVYYENRWYDETQSKQQHKITRLISEDIHQAVFTDLNGDVSLSEEELSKLNKILRTNTSDERRINNIVKHIISKANERDTDFNSDPFLLGFTNGVYDLANDEFRAYEYSDYITLTTRYDYENPDYEIPEIVEAKELIASVIESIHPDPEKRLLYLQVLASGLDGRAYQKLFLLNGQGGNGKGLTGSLMDITLGDYYHQPANGIIKDVEKANAPSPDMINLKNKRYINFKEVQGAIRVAMLRNLTGGGKFSGRLLQQNPEQFFMSGTFVMEFNTSPELDGKPEQADYRRLVDLDFPVNFTDNPDKIDKVIGGVLYKKANSFYETQQFLQQVKLVFLDMLLGIYRTYRDKEQNTGIVFTIPESIKARTAKFLENQNLFQRVFNEIWEKVEYNPNDPKDIKAKTIQVRELWDSILASAEHRALNYRDKRQYSRDDFYKWIEGLFKIDGNTKTGKIIIGIRRKEDNLDPEPANSWVENAVSQFNDGTTDDETKTEPY